ncbi:MAG: flagellar basal body-associated FliL family protein [Sideroxydans sp.]|jgi:flagellar FliL protein
MANPVKAAPAENVPAAPVKSKKRLIIIIALLVLIAGGGAGWYFTQGHAPEDAGAKGSKKEIKAEPVSQPKYIPLGDKFTVNLQQEEGDRYLQVGITLKILDDKLEERIKTTMPEIRSKLLLLLSSKTPSELVSVAGKQALVQQIITAIDQILGVPAMPAPVAVAASAAGEHGTEHAATPAPLKTAGISDVLFSDFIIQ